jgi:SAM-dependent methyltransferase
VEEVERQRYRSSFGAVAVKYAEHRPDYAESALRWALELAPGTRVLDLGAGTGKLTEGLVALGVEVIAVEPDPAMLAQLRHAMPNINALAGSAEAIPLADASVDAVLAGNALHWFDMEIAGPEIARVLAPDGILAGLWNIFDNRIGWVAELARVGGSQTIGTRDMVTNWHYETARIHLANVGANAHFDTSEQAVFQHGQRRTADTLVATFATKAGILVMPEREREAVLLGIRNFLVNNPETSSGEFTLPMQTGVLRVRRLNTIVRRS